MTLKSITLHRAATDNTGAFKDAGSDLTVGDAEKADFIAADRARELLGSHGAVGHYQKPATEKPKPGPTKAAARKAPALKRGEPAKGLPIPTPPVPPVTEPFEPAIMSGDAK